MEDSLQSARLQKMGGVGQLSSSAYTEWKMGSVKNENWMYTGDSVP